MYRFISLTVILLWSVAALGHHSVNGIYDDQKRFTIEVEVRKFELVNPHPLIFVEITDIPEGQRIDGMAVGQTWTLEMDNRRELTALGFNNKTFIPGTTTEMMPELCLTLHSVVVPGGDGNPVHLMRDVIFDAYRVIHLSLNSTILNSFCSWITSMTKT